MTGILSSMLRRMRADVRLATVTLYCVSAFALITPFAVYRLLTGDILIGLVDLGIVTVFICLTGLTWTPGRTRIGADLTACSATLAVLGVVYLLGLSPLWTFSTLVSNFLIARLRVAVGASAVLVAGVTLNTASFASTTEQMTFLTVATLASLFSLIFASRVARQHLTLTHLASRDGLTGAFNRRTMDHDLQALQAHGSDRAARHCLAIIDLDNFKTLNDQFGHMIGDETLTRFTQLIDFHTRAGDRFYRYGGEEFVLLLPNTPIAGAAIALENLRQALSQQLMGPDGPVNASYGLAELQTGESVSEWLARADAALMKAKRGGKNRVMQAD